MDFHSLLRRDLQFLCKRNKIPANMTNVAMADALKSLETVEGIDEYMNQSDSNVLQSPISVAKLPPSTVARTTRRKTAAKPEPQSSRLTGKSLDGEMDQENMNKNVKFDVAKTPAARSTRKASAATSCTSKVQESKKGEMVQSAYSTRRSTRLLEKCMADLSLKTKETLEKPEKIEETEQEVSTEKKNPAGSEEKLEDVEVIPGRDLSASMEKEWELLKNDDDIPVLEHVNTEITKENKESKNFETFESLVQVDHQLTEEVILENVSEPEKANTFDEKTMGDQTDGGSDSEAEPEEDNSGVESDDTISEAGSNQADHQEIELTIQENVSEPEKTYTLDEEPMVDQTDGDSEAEPEEDNSGFDSGECIQEIEQTIQENVSQPEKTNTFDEERMVDQTDGDSEAEPEEEDSGGDSDGTISEADSNQADHQEIEEVTQENVSVAEKIITLDEDAMVETDGGSGSEQDGHDTMVETDGDSGSEQEQDHQEIEEVTQENESVAEQIITLDEDTMVETDGDSGSKQDGHDTMVETDGDSESEQEQDDSGLNQSVQRTAPTSPLVLEETLLEAAPFVESVSAQFPRPSKSASKNSAMKLVNVENMTKENNMELMMMNVVNGESKGEAAKKNKKVEIDEENLNDVSMRRLVKMVKELSIKSSSNRTALKILPGNNQIAE